MHRNNIGIQTQPLDTNSKRNSYNSFITVCVLHDAALSPQRRVISNILIGVVSVTEIKFLQVCSLESSVSKKIMKVKQLFASYTKKIYVHHLINKTDSIQKHKLEFTTQEALTNLQNYIHI